MVAKERRMFKKIMVPVELGHLASLDKALKTAADLARANDAEIAFVEIYGPLASGAGKNPPDHAAKLRTFATEQAAAHGVKASAVPVFSHDPTAELTSALMSAITDTGADAVVMASHVPGWAEHIFHSNAGYIACHAPVSVFVVR
jgi:nucleotide-binding universal stress UspA family protein